MFRKNVSPKIVVSILLLIGSLQVIGQGSPTGLEWQKCYGWDNYHGDEGTKIIPLQDGNFATIGKKSLNGLEIAWFSKIGSKGNIIWETSIYDNTVYTGFRAQDIIQNPDGSFMVLARITNYSTLQFSYTNGRTNQAAPNKGNFDILVTKLNAEGRLEWFKTFGGEGEDIPVKILPTNDNGFMLLSHTASTNGDMANSSKNTAVFNQDLWLAKLDQNGALLSKKCIGGDGDEVASDMKKSPDGSFVIAGYTTSNDTQIAPNKGGRDILVVKIDNAINVVWKKTYGGSQKDEARRVLLQPNGELLVGVNSNSSSDDFSFTPNSTFPNNFEENIWLLKLNSNGEILNKKMFGGSGRDLLNDLIAAKDGNFVLAGSTRSNNGDITDRGRIINNNLSKYDGLTMKISPNLDFIWEKTVGGSSDDESNGVAELSDGTYIVVGTTQSFDGDVRGNHYNATDSRDIWLYKTNFNCEADIVTSRDVVATNADVVASATITTSDKVTQSSSIHYGAGKSIEITAGFNADLGTVIEFNLDGCTSTSTTSNNPIQIKVNNECREGGMKFKFMPFTPNTDLSQYRMSVQNLDPKIEFSFSGNTLITKNNQPNSGNAYFLVTISRDGYEDFAYQSYTSTCEHDNAPIDCPENNRDVILNKEFYTAGETFTANWTGTLLPTQNLSWYNENVTILSTNGNSCVGRINAFPAHLQAQPGRLSNGDRPCHGSTRVEFRQVR